MRLDDMVRMQHGRGSFMPSLMKLMEITTGTVLELGAGYVSTPYLHWATYRAGRNLVTYESHPLWYEFAGSFAHRHHRVHFVRDWDSVEFPECSIALVDHSPEARRRREVDRLTHADYVVVHDADSRHSQRARLKNTIRRFRYRFAFTDPLPMTIILSNKYDMSGVFG